MPGKFKIVVSDLHLSAGHEAAGNPLEDFGSDAEFADLLAQLAAESDREGKEVELIVNGDAFEMLQVPHVDTFDPQTVYPPEDYYSSSEADSARKMALIIDGHRLFFDALRDFVQVGPPRRYVTFVKGNHDVNLHWLAVQDLIRAAMEATGAKAPLLGFEERRVRREGIYVEHGNQYAEGIDRIEDMEEPHDHDDLDQLAIPPGSWFVMNVFNDVERERYWIDGVKPITALIFYALRYDFAFAVRAIATLVKALPGTLAQIVTDTGEPTPVIDLARNPDDPARVEAVAERYRRDEAFRTEFNARLAGLVAPPTPLPAGDALPLPGDADAEAMGEQVQARMQSSLFEWAARRAVEEGVKVVTFGHTHEAGVEALPNGGVYVNSGTWTWHADFGGAGKETWQDLFEHPERFTGDRVLNYVRIDYDPAGEPRADLLAYEPAAPPEEMVDEVVEEVVSLWDRFVAWLRRTWTDLAGG